MPRQVNPRIAELNREDREIRSALPSAQIPAGQDSPVMTIAEKRTFRRLLTIRAEIAALRAAA